MSSPGFHPDLSAVRSPWPLRVALAGIGLIAGLLLAWQFGHAPVAAAGLGG